jgi:hypothetical protein
MSFLNWRDNRKREKSLERNTRKQLSSEDIERLADEWAARNLPEALKQVKRAFRAGHASCIIALTDNFSSAQFELLDAAHRTLAARIHAETQFRCVGGASRDYESRVQYGVTVYF